MMNEEEKFDELLSSKLSERDFPFDELNWDEAERLIIRQERRRKVIGFAGIFVIGLIAGVLIMLPFITGTHNALPNVVVNTTSKQNSVLPSAGQSQINTNNSNEKKEAPLPVHSAFVKKDTRTGIRSNSSNISTITKTHKKRQSVAIADGNKSNHKLPTDGNLLASAREVNKGPEHAETVNQEKSNVASSQAVANSVAENKAQVNAPDKIEKGNTENGDTNKKSKAVVVNANKQSVKKDSNNTPGVPLLRDAEPLVANSDYSHNILSIYAGGDYSFGWNDNGDKEANGITPWAGINYVHYFSAKVSASLGVGFSELNGLNKTYTISTTQYDFGANNDITTITPQTIYYLALPLKIQYNFDSKDVLALAYDYLYMLTTSSIVSNYQQTYFLETAGTSKKEYGYTQGFSSSDMQFAFSYTRMLTGRLGISAEFYLGFNSIENSSFPSNSEASVERQPIYTKNNGFRLVVCYQLIK